MHNCKILMDLTLKETKRTSDTGVDYYNAILCLNDVSFLFTLQSDVVQMSMRL